MASIITLKITELMLNIEMSPSNLVFNHVIFRNEFTHNNEVINWKKEV